MRTAFAVLFKILGGLTFTGALLFGLIMIETIVHYSSKPSTRLQSLASDAPDTNIEHELDALYKAESQIKKESQAAKDALAQQQAIQTELVKQYETLLARVDEQNLMVWSVPYQP